MARLRSGFVVRYDAPVGPPVWLSAHTATTRARGVLHPHVRAERGALLFRTRGEAEAAVAARPRPERAVIVKTVR